MAKREYGKWCPESMNRALKEYRECKIGLNEIQRKYGIPKKTFLRHHRGEVQRGTERTSVDSVNGRELALPPKAEEEFVRLILEFESSLFGLTPLDVRRLAYQILDQNPHLQNRFNTEKKIAGKKWYYSFLKRHPELSLRQPEKVSASRAKGFNKENVSHFFDVLEKVVDENGFNGFRIFNVDESGFQTVQKKAPKILAMKGKKRVGALTSAERGVNTTIVCCTNAVGVFVPPMIIFKRSRMEYSLASGAPAGSLVEVSESGYINSELFLKWFKHFVAHVRPSKEEKVLLLLDGHTTHSKNLDVINLARESGVLLLQLPGHTTHRLQPLDVSVFKPFQLYYDEAVTKWHRTNPPPLRQCHVSSILSEAYVRVATMSNAMNGFKATGVWPVDRQVFKDTDFVAAKTLTPEENDREDEREAESEEINRPTTPQKRTYSPVDRQPRKLHKTVHEISPVPCPTVVGRNNRQPQKAELLTASPYKNKLEARRKEHSQKYAKNLFLPGPSTSSNLPKVNKKTSRNKKTSKSNSSSQLHFSAAIVEINKDDWFCKLCQENLIEDMVQCSACKSWVHESCAGVSKDKLEFTCDFCLQND